MMNVRTRYPTIALLTLSLSGLASCSESDNDSADSNDKRVLALLELPGGVEMQFTEYGDGEIGIDGKGQRSDLVQVESLKRFGETSQAVSSITKLYEMFAEDEAPEALVAAEARVKTTRDAESNEDNDEDVDTEDSEEAEGSPEVLTDSASSEFQPLMSGSDFEDDYCDTEMWRSGYSATSTRCKLNRDELDKTFIHASSSKKEGTHSIVNTFVGDHNYYNFTEVIHGYKIPAAFGGHWRVSGDAITCYKGEICFTGRYGKGRERRVAVIIPTIDWTVKYHVWSAILAD